MTIKKGASTPAFSPPRRLRASFRSGRRAWAGNWYTVLEGCGTPGDRRGSPPHMTASDLLPRREKTLANRGPSTHDDQERCVYDGFLSAASTASQISIRVKGLGRTLWISSCRLCARWRSAL